MQRERRLWWCLGVLLIGGLAGGTALAGVITSVRVSLGGPGERTLVRPPDYPASSYVYTAVGEYDVEEEDGDENPPGNIEVKYTWSWGNATHVSGGGEDDTSVTITFDETNDADTVVTVTYTVTSDNGDGSDTAEKLAVVPAWDPYKPIAIGGAGSESGSPSSVVFAAAASTAPDCILGADSGDVFLASTLLDLAVSPLPLDEDRRTGEHTTYHQTILASEDDITWLMTPHTMGWFWDGDQGASVRAGLMSPTCLGMITYTVDDDRVQSPGNLLGSRDDSDACEAVQVDVIASGFDADSQDMVVPWNSPTLIKYILDPSGVSGQCTVQVYSSEADGSIADDPSRTIVGPEEKSGGIHSVSWDGTDDAGDPVPAGVYWLYLEWDVPGTNGGAVATVVTRLTVFLEVVSVIGEAVVPVRGFTDETWTYGATCSAGAWPADQGQPVWSVSGVGSIDEEGVYTPPQNTLGTATVTATSGASAASFEVEVVERYTSFTVTSSDAETNTGLIFGNPYPIHFTWGIDRQFTITAQDWQGDAVTPTADSGYVLLWDESAATGSITYTDGDVVPHNGEEVDLPRSIVNPLEHFRVTSTQLAPPAPKLITFEMDYEFKILSVTGSEMYHEPPTTVKWSYDMETEILTVE